MENNYLKVFEEKQSELILATNSYTEQFGLMLTKEDVNRIIEVKSETLKEEKRIELGESIVTTIIHEFCDSPYITEANYADTLIKLQAIFFKFKNEMEDEITDDELVTFMKEQFDGVCFGDTEYLETTCLEIFAEAIRAGYEGYKGSEGEGEFEKFDIVKRWDRALYLEVLNELIQ